MSDWLTNETELIHSVYNQTKQKMMENVALCENVPHKYHNTTSVENIKTH